MDMWLIVIWSEGFISFYCTKAYNVAQRETFLWLMKRYNIWHCLKKVKFEHTKSDYWENVPTRSFFLHRSVPISLDTLPLSSTNTISWHCSWVTYCLIQKQTSTWTNELCCIWQKCNLSKDEVVLLFSLYRSLHEIHWLIEL